MRPLPAQRPASSPQAVSESKPAAGQSPAEQGAQGSRSQQGRSSNALSKPCTALSPAPSPDLPAISLPLASRTRVVGASSLQLPAEKRAARTHARSEGSRQRHQHAPASRDLPRSPALPVSAVVPVPAAVPVASSAASAPAGVLHDSDEDALFELVLKLGVVQLADGQLHVVASLKLSGHESTEGTREQSGERRVGMN